MSICLSKSVILQPQLIGQAVTYLCTAKHSLRRGMGGIMIYAQARFLHYIRAISSRNIEFDAPDYVMMPHPISM